MKPPQRTEAERIAKSLTKAQRDAVTGRKSVEGVWFNLYGSRAGGAYARMCGRLADLGIVKSSGPYPLTPLGLAVREVLLSQEQTDER